MRTFDSLTEREALALAISLEEEDERIFGDYAEACGRISRRQQRCLTGCARRNQTIADV